MLPDLENCDDHRNFDERRDGARMQSSISKRASDTKKSLREIGEGVQKRLQTSQSLQRIGEDDANTPRAPPRPNREIYRNSIETISIRNRNKNLQSTSYDSQEQDSHEENVVIHRHYYTIAYTIVIIAYLAGFTEYLYFRLTSILVPEHLVFHPPCEGKANRKIGKDGFHYGVSICAFIGIAIFQLMCFFGLTISEKWTKTSENPRDSQQAARRVEFAQFIRNLIATTMYRVFICYAVCALINCAIIFYMVGIQDSLGDIVSTILLYIFDVIVILYFIAFPLTTAIYHPYIECFKKRGAPRQKFRINTTTPVDPRTQTSTLESNIENLDAAIEQSRSPTIHIIPKLNFSRDDPLRQPIGEPPILENYLQSPRRALPRRDDVSSSESDDSSASTNSSRRYSTLV
ncbi:unnamed protein product [Caenorhabditis bovis]|uniref:Uncharacterized protein n=1 Tax=Caenorhabditis bovis TaxID=2654633 RepID=A0A8S1FBR1_9PELO|nr:unnamed protein product [Caenorhabditis bovis]